MQTMEMTPPVKTLPNQLQNELFGFVRLRARAKIPVEADWPNRLHSWQEAQAWLDEGANYGLQCGRGDLVIIDADTPEAAQAVEENLPVTFTVKSPRKGFHYYYRCPEIVKKIVLKAGDVHFGEVLSTGSQAVGPGSIHPDTGTEYVVVNDVAIVEVSRADIFSALAGYIPHELSNPDPSVEIGDIRIEDVLSKKGISMKKIGNQLVGGHPVHGSTNNNNFVVSSEKNVWHCFRCGSGGGPLSLVAVLDGVISCAQAIPGALRGEQFAEVLRIAKEKYAFDIKVSSPNSIAKTVISDDKLTALEAKVVAIPKETSPVKLPALLDPILKEIALINIAQGDAFLKHVIKERFGLTGDALRSYEKVLKGYRKEPKSDSERKTLTPAEIVECLHEEESNVAVHPAQDYANGLMVFSVKVKDTACLVTSDQRIFALADASSEGLILKQGEVDASRFSARGVTTFLDGQYQVSIPALYEKISGYIVRFIRFPEEAYLAYLTLWVMGTYVFMLFRYYPYVWLNAEKGSGKTLLMEIMSVIAFNGDLITNPTESVIFRDISNNLISMFIDEVEQLRKRDKDTYGSLISVLNSGFNKAGMVKRSESTGQGGFVVKAYSTYSPKMFAGISDIDDVLQDRTVRISLLRKKDDEAVERYKGSAEILELQRSIRDDLYVFALTFAKDIIDYYHATGADAIEGLAHLNNRELDIWEPIFLLANIVDAQRGDSRLTDMMEALSKKSLEEKQSDSVSQNETYKILSVLKVMVDEVTAMSEDGVIRVYDAERVLEYFKANEDFEWIQKTNVLTRRLKKVKVTSDQRRVDGEKKRVYVLNTAEIADLCERFKI